VVEEEEEVVVVQVVVWGVQGMAEGEEEQVEREVELVV